MHWTNLNSFLSMGGYGFYVWASFGLTFLALVLEFLFELSCVRSKESIDES